MEALNSIFSGSILNYYQDYDTDVLSIPGKKGKKITPLSISGIFDGSAEDVNDLQKQIDAKIQEIFDLESNTGDITVDYQMALAKRRLLSVEIRKLEKRRLEITSRSEADLRRETLRVAQIINRDGKKSLDFYDSYSDLYPRLEGLVKQRLITEKKITENQAWTFKNSALADENKDETLKHKSDLTRAEDARVKMEADIQSFRNDLNRHFHRPFIAFVRAGKGDLTKFLEEWLKDLNNAEAAQETRKALEGIANLARLNDEQAEVLNAIKKAPITPKDFPTILKEIVDGKDGQT